LKEGQSVTLKKRAGLPVKFITIMVMLIAMVAAVPLHQAKAASGRIPYSFFLEHPYSITAARGNMEIVSVDGGGALIMNELRLDLNLSENLFGVYAKFPFAGVTSGVFGSGDYDFGNIGLGTKYALLNTNNSVFTFGFEVLLPTTGNNNGALGARSYFRDFAAFTNDAYTFVPYGAFAYSSGIFSFQANLDFDIMTNAKDADQSPFDTGRDDTELIIEYGAAAGITPNFNLPFSTSFLLELLLDSSTSFEKNVTGAYLTPGVRFGGQAFSVGAGLQVPFGSDEISDFANLDFLVDMIVRFGS
jgi:hypothetical protein